MLILHRNGVNSHIRSPSHGQCSMHDDPLGMNFMAVLTFECLTLNECLCFLNSKV